MVRSDDPRGEWSQPVLVMAGRGYIDPTPLWDDDGRVWLAYAWAGSRSGINSVLTVVELSADGTRTISPPTMVYDGNYSGNNTVEGPKFYKRDGWYWIFAPAGGVATGWQLAMRSRNVTGPYEARTVMAQGTTDINGPHQGAWVETAAGESWFINFQDMEAYGRVVHLNPMTWRGDGWPVIGVAPDGDGCGEPVRTFRKPRVGGGQPLSTPPDSDEFNTPGLGLQWQWPANYDRVFGFPTSLGVFRLNGHNLPAMEPNLWNTPNMLLQKFPAPEFTAQTKLRFTAKADGDRAGLIVMGLDYGAVQVVYRGGEFVIEALTCIGAETGGAEKTVELGRLPLKRDGIVIRTPAGFVDIHLRVDVASGGVCRFAYSPDGKRFTYAGETFTARPGKWVGAKVGIFASTPQPTEKCWADIDSFKVTGSPRF
jgi:beta-xylosidase